MKVTWHWSLFKKLKEDMFKGDFVIRLSSLFQTNNSLIYERKLVILFLKRLDIQITKNTFVLSFASVIPFLACSQLEHAKEVTKTLCSPQFHGRGYVNSGDSIAAEFVATEFKKAGCQSFSTGQFQAFDFKVNTFPNKMNLSVNGKSLKAGVDYVVNPSSGGGTNLKAHIYTISTENAVDDKKLSESLNTVRTAIDEHTGNKLYEGICFNTIGLQKDTLAKVKKKAIELANQFLTILLVDGKFTWSVSDEQFKFPLIEIQRSAIENVEGEFVLKYEIEAVLRNHTARNVIGYAPAKKKTDKWLVYTAHYDHLGQMGNDAYFPGGNDNASGTAMLIEFANYFIQHPSKFNIAFIAFAGEEAGLLGSNYYVEHPIFPLKDIRFLTNVDIMGSGEEGVTVVNATLFSKEFKSLQKINKKKKYLTKIASRGPAANSDHYFFTQAGVPAFFLYTMGPNKHYHDVYDTYEELSFNEFEDIFNLLIDFGKGR